MTRRSPSSAGLAGTPYAAHVPAATSRPSRAMGARQDPHEGIVLAVDPATALATHATCATGR